jgi:drug/metabolite transporter (DMT)-like permease
MKSSVLPIGVLFAIAAYATYSWADGIVKFLGGSLGIFEIGAFTTLFSVLPALLTKARTEAWRDTFRFRRPVLVNIMAVLRVVSSVCITYSFVTIPLAEAYCLVFLIPVFITILSVVVLKEQVGIDRWVLVLVSFAGVLLVVRPGFRELELGHLTALICACSAAFAATITRLVSSEERRISLFMLPTLYILGFNVVMMAFGFAWPTLIELGVLLCCGVLGGIGYLFYIAALANAEASQVAPMQYTQIVWALIMGALFFNEIPDTIALAGLAVIVVAGIAGILIDGNRTRIAGRFAAYRMRKSGANPEPPPLPGPREV